MKIVVASDSFKGCCTTQQVAQAVCKGVACVYPDAQVEQMWIADGGEGTMRTLTTAGNGRFVRVMAHDAKMRTIESEYGVLRDGTAVIEMAETGGLCKVTDTPLCPLEASSYGLGEQIAHAIKSGCKRLLIGLGGSATTDGGKGMLEALADEKADVNGVEISVLCDVTNPLYGPQGAAYIFAPQKGADVHQVEVLDQRLRDWAATSPHPEYAAIAGAGAAGGLGFACMCWLGARLVPGIETVLDYQGFEQVLKGASLVVTGEGRMDAQTLMNKAPLGVLRYAKKWGVKCIGLAGKVEHKDTLLQAGFADVLCINEATTPLEQAMQTEYAMKRIELTIINYLR